MIAVAVLPLLNGIFCFDGDGGGIGRRGHNRAQCVFNNERDYGVNFYCCKKKKTFLAFKNCIPVLAVIV